MALAFSLSSFFFALARPFLAISALAAATLSIADGGVAGGAASLACASGWVGACAAGLVLGGAGPGSPFMGAAVAATVSGSAAGTGSAATGATWAATVAGSEAGETAWALPALTTLIPDSARGDVTGTSPTMGASRANTVGAGAAAGGGVSADGDSPGWPVGVGAPVCNGTSCTVGWESPAGAGAAGSSTSAS